MTYFAKVYQKSFEDTKPEKAEKKKPKPIRKQSAKREVENKEYLKKRILFLSLPKNKICPITKGKTTEVHHTYSGKDRATHFLDEETWIGVSREGHKWIHDNPKKARELGFLK